MPYHSSDKTKTTRKEKPKKIMTLKEAIEKFESMKNKPKGNMKSSGRLSKRQSDLMKTHKEHHSKLHLDFMRYLMTKKNYCFEISHELAMKIIGK